MGCKSEGSYHGWNKIWKNQSNIELINPMYSEKDPTTIYQFWQKGYANDLMSLIKNRGYNSFCELGSGRGTTTMYLAKAGYSDLTMVDLSEHGFRVAEYSFAKYKLPIPKMILENVEDTRIPSNKYDCIYNIGLLEHFDNPKPTLIESFRLLKPEGMIFMPIVPIQPFYKSLLQRFLFNPFDLFKKLLKFFFKKRSHQGIINRTNYRRDYYKRICEEVGFRNVQCLPYNPYWKVNDDETFEKIITLPAYKWHYNTFKKNRTLSLKTSSLFDLCFLLIAEKNEN